MEGRMAVEDCGCEGWAAWQTAFRVCGCEPVGCAVAARIRKEDIKMQLKNGCMAVKLMEFVGLCGEVPVSLVRKLPGYYDYNRRLVTRLVQEGYMKERRMKGYRRRIVRSLSLTEAGLGQLQRVSPGRAQRIRAHLLAPENGHGNWKRTLRLHRGAACLLATMKLNAVWQPGRQKDAALGNQLTYYSAYELAREYGWDNKGARLSGVLVTRYTYYPLYYLGDSNMRWSEEAERMFLDHIAASPLGRGRTLGSSLLLGESWDLVESLIIHAVNPRSRLMHFTKGSSFHYFTLDDMGLRLMKLLLDNTYLFAFQQHLLQNGVCEPSMLPGYLSSLESLSEHYDSGKGKREVRCLDRDTFFACQIDILKRFCKIGPGLLVIPDRWLLDFEMNGDHNDV